jgi:pilus assembly protein Flp/PilA
MGFIFLNLTGFKNPDMGVCPRFFTILFRKEVIKMLFAPKEKGQGLVEYALILVLVAVVVIVILALLGPAIGNIFSNIVSNI